MYLAAGQLDLGDNFLVLGARGDENEADALIEDIINPEISFTYG